jgi:hypothetical protein
MSKPFQGPISTQAICRAVMVVAALALQAAVCAQDSPDPPEVRPDGVTISPFGDGGLMNMLYDCRQRPQAVYLNKKIFIGYKGGGKPSASGKAKTRPMLISYDVQSGQFSKPFSIGPKSSDHHYCPTLWADTKNHLHVLSGCHKTSGTHLISKRPATLGSDKSAWIKAPQIASKLSYPTVFQIHGGRQLIYYRTDGHTSSWTYRISGDNGKTWTAPKNDVTDLDINGRLDWSSYHTKIPSPDGKTLHVVYTDYDDNKNAPDPKRFFNPRYKQAVTNEWKYNLSYVKIDLQTRVVRNIDGEILKTPIDLDYSKAKCQIWDTQWRGAGVPPVIHLDGKGEPTFLHVLSEDDLKTHNYYYVRRENGKWVQSVVTKANHQWNSGYLAADRNGVLHAYVIVGDSYFDSDGDMDRHGGGTIEEWISSDKGKSWKKHRGLTPDGKRYTGWRFNNIQPVTRPNGTVVEGFLLFYGWKSANSPDGKCFLLHDTGAK